jgi:hypothetical protein
VTITATKADVFLVAGGYDNNQDLATPTATDQNGKAQMVVINQGGQKILVSPSLMASPALTITNDRTEMPMLVEASLQEKVTHGAQIIEAVRSLPPGYQRQALGMTAGMTQPNGAQINIQVLNPGNVSPVLDEVEGALLEGD